MFNYFTLFFGVAILILSGLRYYINHKELPIQRYVKGCDVHRDSGPSVVVKKQGLSPIVMLGLIMGILGNIPNIIILFKDYIIPTLK